MKTTVQQESLPTGGQTLAISGRKLEDELSLISTIGALQGPFTFLRVIVIKWIIWKFNEKTLLQVCREEKIALVEATAR